MKMTDGDYRCIKDLDWVYELGFLPLRGEADWMQGIWTFKRINVRWMWMVGLMWIDKDSSQVRSDRGLFLLPLVC